MQPRHVIRAAREMDLAQVFTRHPYVQVCNTFALVHQDPSLDLTRFEGILKDFRKVKSVAVPKDIEIQTGYGEGQKLNLLFEVLRTKRLDDLILGWMRIDEKELSNFGFDFKAYVSSNLAFFVVQVVDDIPYFHIYAKTGRSNEVVRLLRNYLAPYGFAAVKCILDEERIRNLKQRLGLKTVEEIVDNAFPGIKIRATGEGVDSNPEYLQVTRDGSRNSFVFRSPVLDKGTVNLFRISTGGLVQFFNKVSPKFHLDFITRNLVPIYSYNSPIVTPVEIERITAQLGKSKA